MSSSNLWSLVQELDVNQLGSGTIPSTQLAAMGSSGLQLSLRPRSSSNAATVKCKIQKARSFSNAADIAAARSNRRRGGIGVQHFYHGGGVGRDGGLQHEVSNLVAAEHGDRLRRVQSWLKQQHRSRHHNFVAPAELTAGVSEQGGNRRDSDTEGKRGWRVDTEALKERGRAFLRKAGEHADKILAAGDEKESGDEDTTTSGKGKQKGDENVSQSSDTFYDAPSDVYSTTNSYENNHQLPPSDQHQNQHSPFPSIDIVDGQEVEPGDERLTKKRSSLKHQDAREIVSADEQEDIDLEPGYLDEEDDQEANDGQRKTFNIASTVEVMPKDARIHPSAVTVQHPPQAYFRHSLDLSQPTKSSNRPARFLPPPANNFRQSCLHVNSVFPTMINKGVDGGRPFGWLIDPKCPVHGGGFHHQASPKTAAPTRLRFINKKSIVSVTKSIDSAEVTESAAIPILTSQAYSAKMARKRKRAKLTGEQRERIHKEMTKIRHNLFVISVAFLFLFTAFQGLQNLQTTVHSQSEMGEICLSVLYLGSAASSLFLPPYLLNRLGCKLTLITSISVYALYILAHFIPKWYSLIPASFIVGLAGSALWASKCTYLTEIGIRYAILNVESPNVVIVRFFGIFFMINHLGQVFGNLISSLTLSAALAGQTGQLYDHVDKSCGQFYTLSGNLTAEAANNLRRPVGRAYFAVCGAYFCCCVASVMIVAAFLNTLHRDSVAKKFKPTFQLEVFEKTIEHFKTPRHLLLIPLTIFNGMEQGFIAGEFTKAFVGCCLGVSQIGYVMTSFGVADALCSLVFGPLIKLFGRMPLFMFGAVVDCLMIINMLIWPPNPADTAVFYAIAAAWGMADGVWNTQINGLWVFLCQGNLEVAFANYRLWESIGLVIAFLSAPFMSTSSKLQFLLVVLLTGIIGYGLIELWNPLQEKIERLQSVYEDIWSAHWYRKYKNLFTGGELEDPLEESLSQPIFGV